MRVVTRKGFGLAPTFPVRSTRPYLLRDLFEFDQPLERFVFIRKIIN